jgi:NAD dependent epimerase/dehydratase family enzyme
VVGLILHALRQESVHGPMNVTAPDARSSREFSRSLGAALGRPSWFPTPAPVLHLALGEMAEMLLTGQRVVPVVAEQSGYSFRYARLEGALRAAP